MDPYSRARASRTLPAAPYCCTSGGNYPYLLHISRDALCLIKSYNVIFETIRTNQQGMSTMIWRQVCATFS
jgi:hypothetical protein